MTPRPDPAGWSCTLCLLLMLLGPLAASRAAAASPWFGAPQPEPRTLVQPQSLVEPAGVSREQAANLVQRETGGRVLSVAPVQHGGVPGYEVRVLVDGKRVKDVFVDERGSIRGEH